MKSLTRYLERSVTQTNCNPIGYILALGVIVGGVAYHFREAVLNVIKDCLMICAAAFLIYAIVHITGHVRAHRRKLAHKHKADLEQRMAEQPAGDPVQEAERVVSQAYQGLAPGATQDGSRRVE